VSRAVHVEEQIRVSPVAVRPRHPSITRELAKVAAAVALPLALLLAVQLYLSARSEYNTAAQTAFRHAQVTSGEMGRFLSGTETMLAAIARRPMVRAMDPGRCDPVFTDLFSMTTGYANIVQTDRHGRLVCGTFVSKEPLSFAGAPWFERTVSSGAFAVADPHIGPILGRPVVGAAVPVRNEAGDIVGTVGASIDLLKWRPPSTDVELPEGMVVGIVSEIGVVVARSHEPEKWVGTDRRGNPAVDVITQSRQGIARLQGSLGFERIWGFTPVPGARWIAYAGIPSDAVVGPVIRRAVTSGVIGLGAVLAACLLGWLAVRRLGRPIHDLATVVRRRADGDTSARPVETGPAEIREVARELNALIDREAESNRQRDELLERLTMQLERMPVACILYDADLVVTYFNPAAERILGWPRAMVEGRHPFETYVQPSLRPTLEGVFERVRAGEFVSGIGENERRDGSPVMLDWVNTPLMRADGVFIGLMSMAEDVTDRVRAEEALRGLTADLEQRVVARTAELEVANRELESFSYSVAHDLRAPLRAIDAFTQMLVEECGEPTPGARRALARVHHNVTRMARLIEDLLNLARIQRVALHRTQVDVSTLATAIVDDLRAADPDREVQVSVAPGLVADADPTLARIVLENLLANAWKFTRRAAPARIEVSAERGDTGARFVVRDNGAGFDPRFSDKLFNPFQRLHSEEEFSGTGIGLATVHRIVRRHGGSVTAEGSVGQGATFRFSFG
jgi:PAS domain S-box-containing protein